MGGRSRVAAQMLAGKGFDQIINMSGGIKSWKSEKALGAEELGLELFSGKESPEQALVIAYSLEAGLEEFYVTMAPKVKHEAARKLFEKLSTIEVKHQQRIYEEYIALTAGSMSQEEFASEKVIPAVEGGLTTEEYMSIYKPDIEVEEEVISLAMAIEAQALDLYQRAAQRAEDAASQKMLYQIASEERSHLEQLGKLFEQR
jgi:rubrerythrin